MQAEKRVQRWALFNYSVVKNLFGSFEFLSIYLAHSVPLSSGMQPVVSVFLFVSRAYTLLFCKHIVQGNEISNEENQRYGIPCPF